MRPRSLRARLIAGTIAWLVIALVAGGFALSLAFRRAVELGFEDRIDSLLLAVVGAMEVAPDGTVEMARTIADPRFERAYSGWYWQVEDGKTRLRSRSLWDAVLPLDRAQVTPTGDTQMVSGPRDASLRVRARALEYPSRAEPLVVAVAAPEAELDEEVGRFNRLLGLALGTLGLGLALAVAVQVGYGLRPLRQLAAELARVRSGRSARLGGEYPQEIESLVDAMNDVLDHDASLVERARTHVGNLAHGLKTPLSVLAAETARGDLKGRDQIAEQVEVMTRLVNRHLTRAAAAGSRQVLGARTAVEPVAIALRDTLQRIYAERSIDVDTTMARDLVFAGERQDLEEMFGNLMDNAFKWATSKVAVHGTRENGRLKLAIEDDGPGLSSEHAERALDRGTRLRDDEPGSGLGLAIAAELVGLYGGSLGFARSDLGGLRVNLELPSA